MCPAVFVHSRYWEHFAVSTGVLSRAVRDRCVESTPFSLPFAKKEINVESLEEVIGMPIQALTPKGSQVQLA